jgi:hypothetical protein
VTKKQKSSVADDEEDFGSMSKEELIAMMMAKNKPPPELPSADRSINTPLSGTASSGRHTADVYLTLFMYIYLSLNFYGYLYNFCLYL